MIIVLNLMQLSSTSKLIDRIGNTQCAKCYEKVIFNSISQLSIKVSVKGEAIIETL